ncbi:bifunctional serine/threonine-protein kinase/ABC transporter substrate-binding protein [Streptomyces sp. NPDC048659]|uniref:bifunctional serine/threonine-protein kinase/ABC transporter substrate-binding protein n=1 Tax=Streptomyces sp. NPDC048659 TaxID=3155489 RepID=UPI00343E1455
MRPLRRSDPSALAGYRLLGRLGTGGMGVVYLARSAGGGLAALKVIRAEHAADPGFRARFRREAEAAERITGRWAVRVLGADPEAHEPWLATEFVPGPSLAEAVAGHGPLPEPTVRALGARLADALGTLHTAGLVHRDVKPGNVLLALDGPRLIDFGIARISGATALTATDAMIGTPGFLAPEQARAPGAGEVGPASDVFSLGCVLAYALTGRRPFGTGPVAAVVYRTVHEEPDLDGLPPALLPLVTACLAKDPAARPAAAGVRDRLGPAEGPARDWLPDGLPALIARSSARILDLPVADPTLPAADGAPAGPSRRRLLAAGSAAAVATAGGLTAWLLGRAPAGTDPGSGPGTARAAHTLGVLTDLSGPAKDDGRAQERGLRLAAEAFNARPERPFDLVLKVTDDGGDPARTAAGARALLTVPSLVAVVGPTTTETAIAAATALVDSKVPVMSVVATVPDGVIRGQTPTLRTYFEARPYPEVMIVPFARYLQERGLGRTAVIEDRADASYSWLLVRHMKNTPPAGGTVTAHPLAADGEEYAATVRAALAGNPTGVLYAGRSPRRAALCAKALREQGYRGPCGSVEAVLRPEFLTVAGPAAEGWYFGAGYVDPDTVPGAKAFAAAYRARWGIAAGEPVDRFAVESYDALNWTVSALRTAGRRNVKNPGAAVSNAFMTDDRVYRGVARSYDARTGDDSKATLAALTLWRIGSGRPRCLGPYAEAAKRG